MHTPDTEHLKNTANILKALAHPTRLLFVEVLGQGERCVCELKELVNADFSTVSKHLAVLKNAGIVADDKRGLQVYYRLLAPCVLQFIGCLDGVGTSPVQVDITAVHS